MKKNKSQGDIALRKKKNGKKNYSFTEWKKIHKTKNTLMIRLKNNSRKQRTLYVCWCLPTTFLEDLWKTYLEVSYWSLLLMYQSVGKFIHLHIKEMRYKEKYKSQINQKQMWLQTKEIISKVESGSNNITLSKQRRLTLNCL